MSYIDRISKPVSKAIAAGKYIVISPNFPLIDEAHAPNIRNVREANGLSDAFSCAAARWKQHNPHAIFQPSSLQGVADIIAMFRGHFQSRGQQVPLEQIKISSNRVLSHWGSFFPLATDDLSTRFREKVVAPERARLHMIDVFDSILRNSERQDERDRIPGLHPVLRTALTVPIPQTETLKREYHVLTGACWHTDFALKDAKGQQMEFNGYKIQELLRVTDPELRARIKNAETFQFMAIPFLERWNLPAKPLEGQPRYPINLLYDIQDESQVLIQGDRELPIRETAQAVMQL